MRIMMKKKGTGFVPADVTLIKSLDNPNYFGTSVNDNFGFKVDTDGTHVIVGAWPEDNANGSASGVAYIYSSVTGELIHTLVNPDTSTNSDNDIFGYSVAIDGNYVLVGAKHKEDLITDYSGTVYIFNAITGDLIHTLVNPNTDHITTWDQHGWSVALRGEYAVVGAPGVNGSGVQDAGRIYVYNAVTGVELYRVNSPSPITVDGYAYNLAISDTHFIAGAFKQNGGGKAYIYLLSTGALVHTLDNPNPNGSTDDRFGVAVSIDGNYAIVGANQEDDAGGLDSGKAYIFDVITGEPIYTLDNPSAFSTSSGDQFGTTVSINGNYAIVGAHIEDDASGLDSGKVYVFKTVRGDWTDTTLAYTLDNPNTYGTSAGDKFGESISLSGKCVIVGARYEDDADGSDSGKAYIYRLP